MRIGSRPMRTIWPDADGRCVHVIDQTRLPFVVETVRLATGEAAARAIRDMVVRGAPLIGATAAYGLALALQEDPSDAGLDQALASLGATRPTAVNLRWALERVAARVRPLADPTRVAEAFAEAGAICEEDVAANHAIGRHGLALIQDIAARKRPGEPVNILTHCNAGWLATVDRGTATAPIYAAHEAGVRVHVFVDETRPRNQGAFLTAFELAEEGVPHTLIVDNAGGHLMQRGQVDLCIVGADRIAANGDAANKIGTYLKALAAKDCGVPFYVAAPLSTIDPRIADGVRDIPIEERAPEEVTTIVGRLDDGALARVRLAQDATQAANPAFDVTPARLIDGVVTERGIAPATPDGIAAILAG